MSSIPFNALGGYSPGYWAQKAEKDLAKKARAGDAGAQRKIQSLLNPPMGKGKGKGNA